MKRRFDDAGTGLTRPQYIELLAQRSEPQATFGGARARVQNTLVAGGLSAYFDVGDDGQLVASSGRGPDRCCIALVEPRNTTR